MKLVILSLLICVFAFSLVSAANLTIEKVDLGSTVISELDNSAKFKLKIDNPGPAEKHEIYSLVSVEMKPRGFFIIPSGKSELDVEARPFREVRDKVSGLYGFEYQLKGENSGIFKDKLSVKIVSLKDSLEISAESFTPDDSQTSIRVRNTENTRIDNLTLIFNSDFFETQSTINLDPYEEIEIPVEIKKEGNEKLKAGSYLIFAETDGLNKNAKIDGSFKYLEKEGLSVNQESSGFIIRTTKVNKTNEGNIETIARVEMKRNILTRLFTVYSQSPTVERNGLITTYSWEKNLEPAQSLEVELTTNYTFPFLIVLFVIIVGFMARIYYSTDVIVDKRVSFVKTKGGQFAVKVRLSVKSRKALHNIKIIDRLPNGTKLYDKIGTKPDKIDESTRRLIWNVSKLNSGEERVFSYIVYSELKIIGKFELPSAVLIYEDNGKTREVYSNKTYFMNEINIKDEY